ncbi:MAG: NMD3-related protein [Candidatus Woesearchaeota archaeon]
MEYRNDKGKPVANNYYEGILQIRNPTKAILKVARKMIENKKRMFIAKQIKVRNGYDFYLSSQKIMRHIGNDLQTRFGGQTKISKKLHTVNKQSGKRVYRVTMLFRLYNLKVGDVVRAGAKFMKITRLGRRVYGIDIEKNRQISVDYDKIR